MSDQDSMFGDGGGAPLEGKLFSPVALQTGIRPMIPGDHHSAAPHTKNEVVLQPSKEVKTERVEGFIIKEEFEDGFDSVPNISFGAAHEHDLSAHSTEQSDDDCMIIDREECSVEARGKWSQDIEMNIDPNRLPAPVADPIAAQRVMMEHFRNKQSNQAKRGGQEYSFLSTSSARSQGLTPHDSITIEDTDMERFNTDMCCHDDDDEWMEARSGCGEEDEMSTLTELKDSLERRRRLRGLSKAEIFELAKLKEKLDVRKRREEAANEPMFISDDERLNDSASDTEDLRNYQQNRQAAEEAQRALAMQHDSDGALGSKETVAVRPAKRRRPAQTAREVEERREEQGRKRESRKQARALNSKSRGKGKKATVGKAGAKVSTKQLREKIRVTEAGGSDETLRALLTNLVQTNFMEDRQNQGDFGDAPDINERTKRKQLEALQASAPAEYDTHKLKVEKSDLLQASRRFGYKKVSASNGKWLLKGMITSLYHHQLLAADWMVSRELGATGPFGGLLADGMGMGKTIEALAAMVGNPPSVAHIKAKTKATLLVLPSSAIKQWRDEIRIHVEADVFPLVVHFTAKKEIPISALQTFDIVLTSYTEVWKSFPYPKPGDLKTFGNNGGYARWLAKCKEITGDLHKIEWYRIILDEAHAIKNFKSRTSLACQNLRGQYRWALSGTPIQNRLDELFPYFRFLRAPWANDYSEFLNHFCDPDAPDANARIHVLLSIVMLRRTLKDRILGRPIVELPPINPTTQLISFSKEEWVLYKVIEDNFRENLNRHFASGTAQRNYSLFMVQLLRLRQCTSHPFLLERTIKESLGPSDLMKLKSQLKRLSRISQPMYEQISQWVQETEDEKRAARCRGEPAGAPGEIASFGKSEFGKVFRMGKFLDSLAVKDVAGRMVCRLCGDHPTDPWFIACHHCFCCECLRNYMANEVEREGEMSFYECPDPSCRKIFELGHPFEEEVEAIEEEPGEENDGDSSSQPARHFREKKSKKRRGGATLEGDLSPGSSDWFSVCQNDPQKYLLPSAKMIALKAQILKWLHQAPSDKVLIFTQFRLLVKIIALICEQEGWGTVSFTGDMGQDERHRVIKDFHNDPKIQIMIAGLKCGGQALNLTCANRVISVDLWWNHSVEQQAFGRVFRIGQKKETFVNRMVVKGTVDQRLLAMQADKVLTIDKALQDTGACMEPLSIEELASLFGHLSEDEEGRPYVEADNEDQVEGTKEMPQQIEDEA